MIENNFEIFVTVDRNLQYQQNLEKIPLSIFVLCAVNNRRETLSVLIPKLFKRLEAGNLENITEIF